MPRTGYRRSNAERADAARLFEAGLGYRIVSKRLGIPRYTVKQWLAIYRAAGIEGMLKREVKQSAYPWETKVAVARAVVDEGVPKPEAMERFGVRSVSPVHKWCAAYLEGGPEALRPRPKGRPKGARPKTREQELEEENRRLKAEVAYLKKLRSLEAAKRAPGRNAR